MEAKFLAGLFTTPEDLARQVAAAVHRRGVTDRLGSIALRLGFNFSDSIMVDGAIVMSELDAMPNALRDALNPAALRVDLRDGRYWWSTRLFFLASVAKELSDTRLIIFTQNANEFVGVVTPATLRERIFHTSDDQSKEYLRKFELRCRENSVQHHDLAKALRERCSDWNEAIPYQTERNIQVIASNQSLERWLGADLLKQPVKQDKKGLSPAFLRDVMNWPHPYVPVTSGNELVSVIDRAALTERLATLFIDDLAEAYS
jgi:hypothetical protein